APDQIIAPDSLQELAAIKDLLSLLEGAARVGVKPLGGAQLGAISARGLTRGRGRSERQEEQEGSGSGEAHGRKLVLRFDGGDRSPASALASGGSPYTRGDEAATRRHRQARRAPHWS